VAILLMHRTADFRNHIATRELARRGFLVLGMNSRFEGDEGAVSWEELPLDAKAGVELLKKQPGITKVVLFCHSGGGSLLGAYQALAENGVAYSQGPKKITQETDQLAGLPPADGMIFVDAHPGIAVSALRRLNPAVVDEVQTEQIDPTLDGTNPENGYRSDVESIYTDDFRQRYIRGQASRMDRLIDRAQSQLAAAKEAGIENPGGQEFVIAGPGGMSLTTMYPNDVDRTKQPRQFLKNDGTIVTQQVVQVRPRPNPDAAGRGGARGGRGARGGQAGRRGRSTTLQSFLTAGSVRGVDSLDNIDWCSTNSTTPCAAAAISVPVLVTAMGGHSFIRDGEVIFEATKSADKEFIVIEGATHYIDPCTACEETPGQYSNVTKNHFDYVAKWINTRFN
jgi:hypothetical protein